MTLQTDAIRYAAVQILLFRAISSTAYYAVDPKALPVYIATVPLDI